MSVRVLRWGLGRTQLAPLTQCRQRVALWQRLEHPKCLAHDAFASHVVARRTVNIFRLHHVTDHTLTRAHALGQMHGDEPAEATCKTAGELAWAEEALKYKGRSGPTGLARNCVQLPGCKTTMYAILGVRAAEQQQDTWRSTAIKLQANAR